MELRGLDPRTELLTRPAANRRARPSPTRSASRPASPIVFLERRRSSPPTCPSCSSRSACPAERFPELLDADLEHGSLYDFLAERYDCHVERLRETLEPILLPQLARRACSARNADCRRSSSRARRSTRTASRSRSAGPTCPASAPSSSSNRPVAGHAGSEPCALRRPDRWRSNRSSGPPRRTGYEWAGGADKPPRREEATRRSSTEHPSTEVIAARSPMRTRPLRPAALFAIVAIVFSACGGTATPVPSASASTVDRRRDSPRRRARRPRSAPTPEPTGPAVTIKWFCCLGGGDDPSTLKVFDTLDQGVQRLPEAHHPAARPRRLRGRPRRVRDAPRRPATAPDIVGPVGVGGTNAFAGQWLDLAPVHRQEQHRPDAASDQGVIDLNKAGGDGQFGLPFAIYPSEPCSSSPSLFDEVGLNRPPHEYGTQYQMPDGSHGRLELRHASARSP